MNNKTAVIAACVFSMAGCGEDMPSVSDGQKILEIRAQKEGCLTVSSFEKTNATKMEFGGGKAYGMEYLVTYLLAAPCYGEYDAKSQRFVIGERPAQELSALEKFNKRTDKKKFAKGDKVVIKGRLEFVKKENGWEGKESF
jgi:hypothetical protein